MKNLDKLISSLYTNVAIRKCAEELNNNPEADAYQSDCGTILLDEDEEVQVQIIVTRRKEDFIDTFTIVEHNTI